MCKYVKSALTVLFPCNFQKTEDMPSLQALDY